MARLSRSALIGIFVSAIAMGACSTTQLPDQDLRIVDATPVFKITADILWKDFQSDRAGSERKYHGKAMLVTGVVTSVDPQFVLFGQVQARLLLDTAPAVLKGVEPRQRITLKCFCDKLDTNVVLKSCTKP